MIGISRISDKIKNNHLPWLLLLFLIIILIVIASYRIKTQLIIGPPYDTFDFLANAAEFAGKSIGYTDLRPPFLSFLTSLVFRFDNLSEVPIFVIDGILYILGAIGLYLFLKLRFSYVNSFLGAILYATFPIVLTYVGVGYPDLPSVSISIWALYVTVLAVKKDSKFFLLSFPLAMVAFLTKYNQALIIFPIFLYILINWQKIKNHRNYMLLGIFLSALILIPFLIFFNWKYGNPILPFTDFYGSSSSTTINSINFDYNPDLFFYIKNFPLMIGYGGLLVILTIIGGILIGWFRLVKKGINKTKLTEKIKGKEINLLFLVILLILLLSTLSSVPYLVSELLFFIFCLFLFNLLRNSYSHMKLDLLFLSWLISFLIFSSVFLVKDIRYYLTMMPAFSYFLILGWVMVEKRISLIKRKPITFYLAPVIVLVILISTIFYLPSLEISNQDIEMVDSSVSLASSWLVNYDPQYKNKLIYSDVAAVSAWYLQTNVKLMPRFINGTAYYYSVGNYNYTQEDIDRLNKELIMNNVEYYFSTRKGLNLKGYRPLKTFNQITLFQKE